MSNNKQSSVDWYIIERHNIEIQSRLGEISPIEYDAKLIKIEEQAKAMHKEETESKYQEGREIGKIEILTTQSTSNASAYSEGYNKGFLAALEYMNSTIENKIKLRKYEQ